MYKVYWIRLDSHVDIAYEGYVGITKHFNRRMTEHKCSRKGYHIINAISKHGWSNLEVHVIAECDTLAETLELERKLRPIANIGWNTLAGGGNGLPHSKETKSKISKSMIGNTNTGGFEDVTLVCPYCNKEGQKAAMLRWHFDNCKGVS